MKNRSRARLQWAVVLLGAAVVAVLGADHSMLAFLVAVVAYNVVVGFGVLAGALPDFSEVC